MLGYLHIPHQPLVHPAPIKRQIAGKFLTLIERGFVGPHQIFFQPIAYPHGVVGRMSLVGSETVVIGGFQQIHAHVVYGDVIDRQVFGLVQKFRTD